MGRIFALPITFLLSPSIHLHFDLEICCEVNLKVGSFEKIPSTVRITCLNEKKKSEVKI